MKANAKQANIQTLFQVASKKQVPESKQSSAEIGLVSDNPDIQAFYRSLTPAEQIAHTIANEQLGSSYNVLRTHGFQKWKKAVAIST